MNTARLLYLLLFGWCFSAVLPTGVLAGEEDWPEAECSLVGSQPDTDWGALIASIGTLDAAELGMMLKCSDAEEFETLPAVSDVLRVSGRCPRYDPFRELFCDDEGGAGVHCWAQVDEPLVIDWEGGSNQKDPEEVTKCDVARQTLRLAWAAPQLEKAWLSCWTGAYIESNYDRLDTLHDEVEAAQANMQLVYDLFLEQSLHNYGGSISTSLYLPESSGGELAEVADLVEEVARKTETVGYRLDPDVVEILQLADQSVEEGQFKEALRRYRAAYDRITIQSTKFATGTP